MKAGAFSLIELNGLNKEIVSSLSAVSAIYGSPVHSGDTTVFLLGDIKKSRNYYFILKNVGDFPITDVVLHSNRQDFCITPDSIPLILSEDQTSVIAIIPLSIEHGISLFGTGYAPLLPKDAIQADLLIVGNTKTVDSTDTIISLNIRFIVNALVMCYELYDGNDSLLSTSDFSTDGHLFPIVESGITSCKYYHPKNDKIRMLNTGNVRLIVNYSQRNNLIYDFSSDTIQVNASKEWMNKGGTEPFAIIVYGSGAISDYRQIPLGTDGKSYLVSVLN